MKTQSRSDRFSLLNVQCRRDPPFTVRSGRAHFAAIAVPRPLTQTLSHALPHHIAVHQYRSRIVLLGSDQAQRGHSPDVPPRLRFTVLLSKTTDILTLKTVYRTSTAIEDHTRGIHAVLEPYVETSSSHTLPRRRSALFSNDMPFVESPRVLSPDPLPHPYRSKDSKSFAPRENDSSDFTDTSDTLEPAPARDEDAPLEDCVTRPPLIHRRSSLKKSSSSIRASMDATKNVAWAMDQDWQEQVQKYDAAAYDAEAAGEYPDICVSLR